MKNATLKKRILEISYKHGLSHLGSCLTAVDIIEEIYSKKKPDEPFILSSGHAGLALYVVLEKYYNFVDAEQLFLKHGVHPNRDILNYIDCSTGSLGHGLGIAVGMALADRTQTVWSLISDGECAEGSIWEAMRVKEDLGLDNLKVYLNYNGWGAYKETNLHQMPMDSYLDFRNIENTSELPFLQDQDAHYHVMTKEEYQLAQNLCR
jgi:transketolase